MKRFNFSKLQYLAISCLSLSLSVSLAYISELRNKQIILEESVSELTGIYKENLDIIARLEEFYVRIDYLQRRKDALEELVFRRSHTYLAVTEEFSDDKISGHALLSRSGNGEKRQPLSAVTMPVYYISGFTAADFEYLWQTNKAKNLVGIGEALIKAEQKYGINALVLAAIIVHESNWGDSAIARNKNNLAGLGAFEGSAYSSALSFDSKADSIDYLARLLSLYYINPQGKHYNGPHLLGIGRAYAADPYWAIKVSRIMKQLVEVAVEKPDVLINYLYLNYSRN